LGSSCVICLWKQPIRHGTAIRYSIQWPKLKKRSCLRYWSGSGGRNGSNGSNRCRRYRCPKSEKYWKTLFIGLQYLSF
jgi:hypothetical protein